MKVLLSEFNRIKPGFTTCLGTKSEIESLINNSMSECNQLFLTREDNGLTVDKMNVIGLIEDIEVKETEEAGVNGNVISVYGNIKFIDNHVLRDYIEDLYSNTSFSIRGHGRIINQERNEFKLQKIISFY